MCGILNAPSRRFPWHTAPQACLLGYHGRTASCLAYLLLRRRVVRWLPLPRCATRNVTKNASVKLKNLLVFVWQPGWSSGLYIHDLNCTSLCTGQNSLLTFSSLIFGQRATEAQYEWLGPCSVSSKVHFRYFIIFQHSDNRSGWTHE